MILLDTVVLSELRKARPNPGVLAYLQAQPADSVFISAVTVGEIEAGIEGQRSGNPAFAAELAQWLAQTEAQFATFILPVSPAIARLWGRLCVQPGNTGVDNLIAATALVHNLTMVTRNARHFAPTGVRVLDPFDADSASRPRAWRAGPPNRNAAALASLSSRAAQDWPAAPAAPRPRHRPSP